MRLKHCKPLRFAILSLTLLVLCNCKACSPLSLEKPTTLMSWNVQNLFDGVQNGTEYSEFNPKLSIWCDSLFYDRLELLGSIIIESNPPFGPDILILIEIENKNCIEKLNKVKLNKCGYRHRYISSNEGAIQTAILTRCPIKKITSHRLATSQDQLPKLRDIIEAEIETPYGKMLLFVNHWKSRRGGIEKTELLRIHSASFLNRRIKQKENQHELPILICGDLNTSHNLFSQWGGEKLTALIPTSFKETNDIPKNLVGFKAYLSLFNEAPDPLLVTENPPTDSQYFFSPWLKMDQEIGSYYYKGKWEKLDHFLLGKRFFDKKGLEYHSFEIVQLPQLLKKDGTPKKWITKFQNGYSDHLPLLIRFD